MCQNDVKKDISLLDKPFAQNKLLINHFKGNMVLLLYYFLIYNMNFDLIISELMKLLENVANIFLFLNLLAFNLAYFFFSILAHFEAKTLIV